MERFNALKFEPHPMGNGVRAIMEFPNGYHASVIKSEFSYGGDTGLYELAVCDENGVTYDTPITDDVLGYLTESDVDEILGKILDLPARARA